MIRYLKRIEIDDKKYNACIAKAFNSRIDGYLWYLDIVADNWSVLVLNDYEAVMPLPWRSKYFIKYIHSPLWLLQLGVFSIDKDVKIVYFLEEVFKRFRLVNLRMNAQNQFQDFPDAKVEKQMQFLFLKNTYETIFSNYNRNRKRELQKAEKNNLEERWNDNPENLIRLFKNNVAKRIKYIKDKELAVLLELMLKCIDKGVGEVLSIYDANDNLVASAFFLKHKNKVTELVCSTDFNNRKNGANTFLNDRAIYKYQKTFDIFNFGGSSMKNISNYYKSFGASTETYFWIEKSIFKLV